MAETLFWEYDLLPPDDGCSVIAIGERIKKGTFRPCIRTVPFSTISGALRQCYSRQDINAVGFFEGTLDNVRIDHSANNRATECADLPLTTEALVNPRGKVYVLAKNDEMDLTKALDADRPILLAIGALKSKGLGRCQLRKTREIANPEKRMGVLRTRIPEDSAALFGIDNAGIKKPIYGYLFRPTSISDGVYVRSLFEGSIVNGYGFLLKEIGENG